MKKNYKWLFLLFACAIAWSQDTFSTYQQDPNCMGKACNSTVQSRGEGGASARRTDEESTALQDPSSSRDPQPVDLQGNTAPHPGQIRGGKGKGEGADVDSMDPKIVEQDDRHRSSPLPPKTEFEIMVQSSVGKVLPIFGADLFQGVPSTFAPIDRMPVRAEYVIGPGDELLIRGWGSIELDTRVVVDRNGQVYIPKVGALTVAGLRYEQLAKYLKSTISTQFKEFDLNVTIGQLRSIQIFLLGNVKKPGSYTVSSLSTIVNALFSSGGPSATGSMRSIQLKRSGKLVADLDLYDLLVLGDKSRDASLEPGDVIYIPPVGPRVAISGSVNNPAIFELHGNTTLKECLQFAGGLDSIAGSARIVVEGITAHEARQVGESSLTEGLTRLLQDGDVVRIFPVSSRFENAVTLRGATAQPGRYLWREGMRVSDLIPSRAALITRDYWNRQNALGFEDQNLFGSSRAVVAPTDFKNNPSEIDWEYAVISRLDLGDLKTELVTFNLGKAINDPASSSNVALRPGDVVTVFSQADIAVSVENQNRFVRVEGEVNAPGVYQVKPDGTLRDVLAAAGGLTLHSYLFAADLRRESTRIEQQKQLDTMVARLEAEALSRSSITDPHATLDEIAAQKSQRTEEQTYLRKLSDIHPTGRIVLDVDPKAASIDSLPPLPLEDHDVIRIPSRGGTIEVLGAVNNDNAEIYHERANVSEYLARAGGPTRDADIGRVFVIRADGSVVARHGHAGPWAIKTEYLHLMPGDAIVVPRKLYSTSFMRGLRDWSQIFSQFALGAAAAKVLGQ